MVTVVQDVVVALYTLQIIILDLLMVGVVRKNKALSSEGFVLYQSHLLGGDNRLGAIGYADGS